MGSPSPSSVIAPSTDPGVLEIGGTPPGPRHPMHPMHGVPLALIPGIAYGPPKPTFHHGSEHRGRSHRDRLDPHPLISGITYGPPDPPLIIALSRVRSHLDPLDPTGAPHPLLPMHAASRPGFESPASHMLPHPKPTIHHGSEHI